MSKNKRIHKTYKKNIFSNINIKVVNILIVLSLLALLIVIIM